MTNPLDLMVSFLPGETRRLTRTGVQLHNLQYWADGLAPWVSEGKSLQVYYDPRNITVVYVRSPVGVLIEARVTTPDVMAISLAEWQARRHAERAACKHPDLVAIADASQKRGDQLVSQAKASRRVRRRLATEAAGDPWRTRPAPTPRAPEESPDAQALVPTLSSTPTYYEALEYDHVE